MVELVYKFYDNSYCECLKSESIAKVRFKHFFVHKHIQYTRKMVPITGRASSELEIILYEV